MAGPIPKFYFSVTIDSFIGWRTESPHVPTLNNAYPTKITAADMKFDPNNITIESMELKSMRD